MKKTILMIIACSILHIFICMKVLLADSERPRFKVKDPATQADLEDLSKSASLHNHSGVDGSQQLPPGALLIDNVITSNFEGQPYWNLTDHYLCESTQAFSNSAWVQAHAPTTACGH